MFEIEAGFLAARVLCVSAAVLLAPGFALLSALRVPVQWQERVVLAFSLSYSWIFICSVVLPLCGWTVSHAELATGALATALTVTAVWRRWRRGSPVSVVRPGAATVVVIVAVIAAGIAGWVIESPFAGEEALDFTSMSRFADGGPIALDNTSLMPDTPPVYLFQPYQLALAMITRWAGADPLVSFVKFRSFLAPLCLLCIYALLRRLTFSRAEAVAAFIILVLFVGLEIETWERNSLFPFVRRQGFSAAVLVPALLTMYLAATRAAKDDGERLLRRVAFGVAPVMLAASVSTHAMEMVTFLCFAGTAMVAIVIGIDRGGDRKWAIGAVMALAVAAGAYMTAHSQTVSYIAERGQSRRLVLGEQLGRLATDQGGTFGWASMGGENIFIVSSPLTAAPVLGIPALGIAALRTPAAAALIALGTVPLALMHANPAGSIALRWLITPGTIRDTGPYFMLMGAIGVALGLVALAQGILNISSRRRGLSPLIVGALVLSILIAGRVAIPWLGDHASNEPHRFLLLQAAIAAVTLTIALVRARPVLSTASSSVGFAILAICLAIPLGVPGRVFGGAFAREANHSVITRFNAALSRPSALDWPRYYEELSQDINPSLPIPRAVVDELRRRLPPRQVLLAHQSYSCALVVLVNAYCVNPESVYGDYFRPAARYLTDFVTETEGLPEHPFFNPRPSLTDAEHRLLKERGVSYLLADPEHAEQIADKLKDVTVGVTLEMELDGYRLYKISES